jgi:hypothetical protein
MMIVNNQTRWKRPILDSHYLDTKGLERENQGEACKHNTLMFFTLFGGDEGI